MTMPAARPRISCTQETSSPSPLVWRKSIARPSCSAVSAHRVSTSSSVALPYISGWRRPSMFMLGPLSTAMRGNADMPGGLARLAAPLQCTSLGAPRRGWDGRFLAARPARPHTPAMAHLLTLRLNGENRAFDAPLSVAALLAEIGLDTRKVAVERNEEIVPRSAYASTQLASGDSLEIVHFIGGG